MSAKDNAAVIQLFDLLESRYAMRVIWALSDGHPQTFRLLQDSVGGVTPNTLNTRIKELRAAHLVDHTGQGYRLTTLGADLARRLSDVQQFAGKWSHQQARVAANATAPQPGA
ncbi:MAG: winged helix-turn-helix transcriptional regulator [Hydrogenophaga sp.]|uniref:winged helix-turn-helix transcriptional regulator n=1 Tax=Hydrogenophaga sp. TaxID=1904254 RepID=UPI00261965B8|nr:winged helix-turn-helix transcriptional regulator [Hydrogenophaga sp.]MDM7941834.1 winged helix-turn-helix transcriptional regulator [Hydrogenophaga sp.]